MFRDVWQIRAASHITLLCVYVFLLLFQTQGSTVICHHILAFSNPISQTQWLLPGSTSGMNSIQIWWPSLQLSVLVAVVGNGNMPSVFGNRCTMHPSNLTCNLSVQWLVHWKNHTNGKGPFEFFPSLDSRCETVKCRDVWCKVRSLKTL